MMLVDLVLCFLSDGSEGSKRSRLVVRVRVDNEAAVGAMTT
jgi:hypothetical protein